MDLSTALAFVGSHQRGVLTTIKELEFDRAMGKVSESDFVEMRDRLRARAVRLMRQLEGSALYQQMIERDIQAVETGQKSAGRLQGATDTGQGTAGRSQGTPDGTLAARTECQSCGTVNDFDARFCKACGNRLTGSVES